ncbi:hypothetical protein KC340_g93 [Hortaea werneckii]|nr:hypothetical protein KC340_g93 [Hortaea werneckii]
MSRANTIDHSTSRLGYKSIDSLFLYVLLNTVKGDQRARPNPKDPFSHRGCSSRGGNTKMQPARRASYMFGKASAGGV